MSFEPGFSARCKARCWVWRRTKKWFRLRWDFRWGESRYWPSRNGGRKRFGNRRTHMESGVCGSRAGSHCLSSIPAGTRGPTTAIHQHAITCKFEWMQEDMMEWSYLQLSLQFSHFFDDWLTNLLSFMFGHSPLILIALYTFPHACSFFHRLSSLPQVAISGSNTFHTTLHCYVPTSFPNESGDAVQLYSISLLYNKNKIFGLSIATLQDRRE